MTAEQYDADSRTLKRRHLIYYLEVFDQESGTLLGHLVDINVKGIMLVCKNPLKPETDYLLRMNMPESISITKEICFAGQVAWCKKDVNPDFYAAGFTVSSLDEATRRLFGRLINQVGFKD